MQLVDYYAHLDISRLEKNASCYTVGTNVIYAYSNNNRVRTEYHILGNTLYPYYSQNYNYPYDISNYHCLTYSDISSIKSESDWVMPFYYTLATAIFLILVYCAYRLILYPWFRKI